MTVNRPARFISRLALSVALGALATVLVPQACAAANLVNFSIGTAYGHADVTAPTAELFYSPLIGPGGIDLGHSAYQVMLGMRMLPMLGFEMDYLDLGTVSGSPGSFSGSAIRAKVTQKGEAAFAVIYLPLPVINLYLKAGFARLTSDLRGTFAGTTCPPGVACLVRRHKALSAPRPSRRRSAAACNGHTATGAYAPSTSDLQPSARIPIWCRSASSGRSSRIVSSDRGESARPRGVPDHRRHSARLARDAPVVAARARDRLDVGVLRTTRERPCRASDSTLPSRDADARAR